MTSAKIVAGSVYKDGPKVRTYELTYPRFIHCFDNETEILCKKKGEIPLFKRFSDIYEDEDIEVAQVEPITELITFVKPNEWIKREINEKMIEVNYQRLNFKVTKGHRLYVGSRKQKGFKKEIIKADELLCNHTTKKFYKSGSLANEERIEINPYLAKFVAYFVSDGHIPKNGHQAIFRFKKERKIKEVCLLLKALDLNFNIKKDKNDGVTIITMSRLYWMDECYDSNRNKQLPVFCWRMDELSFDNFYLGLLESDGCANNLEFNSYSEILIDQIQSIFHLNGKSFNKKSYGALFKVKFQIEDTPTVRRDKNTAFLSDYKGCVYCVNVPTGLIMVRRNGIVHISGNCEIMTHRMFSRNAASSRAIPIASMVESLAYDPEDLFERLGLNKSGMQAQEIQLNESELAGFRNSFREYRAELVRMAEDCVAINLHKQIANRFLEPLMHMTSIVTATDMGNFFAQRCHPAAQPELQSLAFKMLKCELDYKFNSLYYGQWHLPYVTEQENKDLSFRELRKMSVARVASVSYIKHGEELTKERCDAIYDKLLEGGHWSPFEHVCTPMAPNNKDHYSGNLKGWSMFRKEFMSECREVYDLQALYNTKPDWIK